MAGRKPTKEALEIITLVQSGKSFSELRDKGYKIEIVKYYIRKLRYPKAYVNFIDTVTRLNKKRLNLTK